MKKIDKNEDGMLLTYRSVALGEVRGVRKELQWRARVEMASPQPCRESELWSVNGSSIGSLSTSLSYSFSIALTTSRSLHLKGYII